MIPYSAPKLPDFYILSRWHIITYIVPQQYPFPWAATAITSTNNNNNDSDNNDNNNNNIS